MSTLVIGGTGFIGLNVVRALQAEGYDVTCTRRRSSNTLFLKKLKPKLVEADCSDFASLKAAMNGMKTVFMIAGHYPRYSVELEAQVRQGVEAIRNTLRAARESGVERFIYTGSVTTGFSNTPERSVYCRVKEAMESEVLRGLSAGLKGTVLRVAGCIGPYDVKVGTSTLLVNAYQESLPFYVDGKINMVDVDEVARAHVEALKIESLKPVYTIAHHNTTVREFLELVSDRYGVRMPKRVPYFVAKPVTQIIERLAVRRRKRVRIPMEFIEMMAYGEHLPAPTRETGLIEFTTPLEESVTRAVDWYVRHGFLKAKNENGKGSHGT